MLADYLANTDTAGSSKRYWPSCFVVLSIFDLPVVMLKANVKHALVL